MLKILTLTTGFALSAFIGTAQAEGGEIHIEDFDFSFEGMFGRYDEMQLQRGLQVYTEVCAGCHGLQYVAFRTLAEEGGPGWEMDDVRNYISVLNIEVFDTALDDGFGDYRLAEVTDFYPNSQDPNAPDLSLMAKARAGFSGPYGTGLNQLWYGMGGPEYIASLMVGYVDPPECTPEDMEGYYNVAFAPGAYPEECEDDHGHRLYPGSWISMPPPLWGEDVEFADGHSNELHEESQDIAAFLMWAAEPGLNVRKSVGLKSIIFLTVLSVLLYVTNKRLWAPIKKGRKKN